MATYTVKGHIGEDGLFTARLPEVVAPGVSEATIAVSEVTVEEP